MINNRCARCNSMGNGQNGNHGGTECRVLMNRIRAVDFALTETVLYLDAYPESVEAMKYYQKLVKERTQLMDRYESQCGPVTMYGNVNNTWDWIRGPWPWEPDAN